MLALRRDQVRSFVRLRIPPKRVAVLEAELGRAEEIGGVVHDVERQRARASEFQELHLDALSDTDHTVCRVHERWLRERSDLCPLFLSQIFAIPAMIAGASVHDVFDFVARSYKSRYEFLPDRRLSVIGYAGELGALH